MGGMIVKRIAAFLSVLLLLSCLVEAVSAAETEAVPYICDTVGLLTQEEDALLTRRATAISQQYQCAVYFITVEDYTDYGSGGIYSVAKAIYQANDLGWGEDKSGVMLLLSMEDRDYALIAYGYGNTAFTDYGKDYLSDRFLDDFADNDWFSGCKDYVNTCESMLEAARNGNPVDVGARPKLRFNFFQNLIPSILVALAICGIWRAVAKKKVSVGSEAENYLDSNGVSITSRRDMYTHTTRIVRHIEKSSGGTSVDRSGFSGKSGKF